MWQVRLIALAVAVLAIGGGLVWFGESRYHKGFAAGKAQVQGEWNATIAEAKAKNEILRADGYTRAQEYLTRLNMLEKRYARTDAELRKALGQQFTCPASGVVGDIVLPASLVDSMFNREQSSDPAAGTATTRANPTVRPGTGP